MEKLTEVALLLISYFISAIHELLRRGRFLVILRVLSCNSKTVEGMTC